MYKKLSKGLKKKKPMTRSQQLKRGLGDTSNMTTAEKQKLITKKAKESAKAMDRRIARIKASDASAKYQQQAQATKKKRKTYKLKT